MVAKKRTCEFDTKLRSFLLDKSLLCKNAHIPHIQLSQSIRRENNYIDAFYLGNDNSIYICLSSFDGADIDTLHVFDIEDKYLIDLIDLVEKKGVLLN